MQIVLSQSDAGQSVNLGSLSQLLDAMTCGRLEVTPDPGANFVATAHRRLHEEATRAQAQHQSSRSGSRLK
jgi:hypothetical protein